MSGTENKDKTVRYLEKGVQKRSAQEFGAKMNVFEGHWNTNSLRVILCSLKGREKWR